MRAPFKNLHCKKPTRYPMIISNGIENDKMAKMASIEIG